MVGMDSDRRKVAASERLRRKYYDGNRRRLAQLEEARLNFKIARKLLELRTAAGLTQQELADRAGTTRSVISRLEDDNYEGHSLSLLRRIADALGYHLDLEFRQREDQLPPPDGQPVAAATPW